MLEGVCVAPLLAADSARSSTARTLQATKQVTQHRIAVHVAQIDDGQLITSNKVHAATWTRCMQQQEHCAFGMQQHMPVQVPSAPAAFRMKFALPQFTKDVLPAIRHALGSILAGRQMDESTRLDSGLWPQARREIDTVCAESNRVRRGSSDGDGGQKDSRPKHRVTPKDGAQTVVLATKAS